MKNFDAFMSEVSDNCKTYSDKEWQKKNEKFEKFSGEWYEKFKDEFTWHEKLKITGHQAKFHYYSILSQTSSVFNEMLNVLNVNEIKTTVRNYVDKGMITELKQLYKQALDMGAAAEEAITEIFNELQINIDELLKE